MWPMLTVFREECRVSGEDDGARCEAVDAIRGVTARRRLRGSSRPRTIWRGTMSFTLDPIGMSLYSPPPYVASVAELADALDSGSSG